MAEQFDEFLEDVEKDMRQEKLENIWKEYGKLISTVLMVAIGGSGGWVLWRNHSEKQLNLTSQKFMKAQELVDRGNISEGLGVYDSLIRDSSKTYASLAAIAKAGLLASKTPEDIKKAEALLTELTLNKSADKIMRDFATVTLIRIDLDRSELKTVDGPTRAKLIAYLVTLDKLSTDNSPYALLSQELKGIILFALNDYAKASEVYVKIAQTKDCPRGLQARAEIMSQLILKKISDSTQ
jgi:hypothetical protein